MRNRHTLRLYFQNWPNIVLHENTKHNQILKIATAKHAGCTRAFNTSSSASTKVTLEALAQCTSSYRLSCIYIKQQPFGFCIGSAFEKLAMHVMFIVK